MTNVLLENYAIFLNGNIELIEKVVNRLTELNTCPFCVLRFLGLKDSEVYRKIDHDIAAGWITSIVKYELRTDFICCVCLGILQTRFSDDKFIDTICNDVINLEYEFDDFLCSITMPVSIAVREHALWLFLRSEYFEVYTHELPKENVIVSKDVWKWINGVKLSDKFSKPLNQKSSFNIQINFIYTDDNLECNFLLVINSAFRKRKKTSTSYIINRLSVQRALDSSKPDWFKKLYKCPPEIPFIAVECKQITCHRDSIYVAGLYNKFSRTLSQTPWFIGDEKKFEDSVEELISNPIKDMSSPVDTKFSASGREDVDVRMLGRGRPFLLELINSKKLHFSPQDLNIISDEINKSTKIKVHDLQVIDKRLVSFIKEGEESKVKLYRALCVFEGSISDRQLASLNETKNLVLRQKTPLRVLHRRTLAVREKVVRDIKAVRAAGERRLIVDMSAQAGTYVKEFVHGDFGRTTPSLGELLNVDCDIIALDVQDIEVNWPPQLADGAGLAAGECSPKSIVQMPLPEKIKSPI